MKMRENGKIALVSLEDVIKSFGCSLNEAISNSTSILKTMEAHKISRTTQSEMNKSIKLE